MHIAKPTILSLLTLTMITIFTPSHAWALASDWQQDDATRARLISSGDTVGKDQSLQLGLDVELAEGWHTYWRSPGAAGLPPQLDWTASQNDKDNIDSASLLYPAPTRYVAYGLETVGYKNHVVFPIDVKLRRAGDAVHIATTADLLVCSSICVPKHYDLKLDLPAGDAKPSAEAALIQQYRDQLPKDASASGLAIKGIASDGTNLTVEIESRDTLNNPDLFVEDAKEISFSAPTVKIGDDQHTATLTVKLIDALSEGLKLDGMATTLTITNGAQATEQKVAIPAAHSAHTEPAAPPLPLGIALLFALVGGFILNLMPCVLPVLSLKILSVVSHGGGNVQTVRRSFLVSAAGLFFSFLILAGVTIALKDFGLTLGWGVQFQQPLFLALLILLLTLFAANLWGIFEILLPNFLADNFHKASYHPKLAGDFATGAFATLLATPCSAPFLGTAVGYALASGPADILMIFSALGLGMVLPYLAIALFPRIATRMPKPGKWMVHLRRLLGCALASTALWLTWVLAAQITPRLASFVGLSMLGIILLLALRRTKVSKKITAAGLVLFVLVTFAVTITGSNIPKATAEVDTRWLPFTPNALAADIDEGKIVFVDVTADWCLTCKANKKFILSQNAISERLFHSDIVAMQADWTNPDPVITDFLHKYGRYGIPFNAVFGPGAPQGLVLPELLTPEAVNDALDKAAQKPVP